MSIRLDDFNLGGYVRINQGENRDIEFDLIHYKRELNYKVPFFQFMVKSFNGDIQNTGFKMKGFDNNGNVIFETDKQKLDFYETEDSYIAEAQVSYEDQEDPTEDRNLSEVKVYYVLTDSDGNDVEYELISSIAPQNSTFAEVIDETNNTKAIVIRATDGKAKVIGDIKLVVLK